MHLYEAAVDRLKEHGVVDAHHHTLGKSQRRERDPGLIDWLSESYLLQGSVRAAGFKVGIMSDTGLSDAEKIASLLPYLRLVQSTTYYRIARQGLLAAFGFDLDGLDESSWRELDVLIHQANKRDDWFEEILGRRMGQRGGVLDKHVGGTVVDALSSSDVFDWYDYILRIRPERENGLVERKTKKRDLDNSFSKGSVKIDSLLYGYLECVRGELRDLFGGQPEKIRNLDDYLDYVDRIIRDIGDNPQLVALKSSIVAVRSLHYACVDKSRAERVFALAPHRLGREEAADFENFMMHHICARAGQCGIPVQIHTGDPFAGFNDTRAGSPSLLTSLILRHPETKFDLMHGGYPYYGECAAMVVRFPNVHLNLSWMTLISDGHMRQALDTWIDCVPANKIMWGGDCVYVEETYGAFLTSLRQVTDVLGARVSRGDMTEQNALWHAERVFCDNAAELFRL